MITKTSSTLTNLKNLFIEIFLDKTTRVSNIADGSVLNATAFGVAKIAQKAMKDIAIEEAQIFPESATGEYLDRAAALYGVSPRKGALGSSTYIRVYAEPGTVYDENVYFVNKNGIRFSVDERLVVDSSGYGYVKVRSVNAGYTTNVEPNSIIQVSPQPEGHIECTNEYYAVGGRDSEDDETFRIRIQNNLNILSKNTLEYWTQIFQSKDDRVLKVMSAGLNEEGQFTIYLASQNGIFFTENELETLLQQTQSYFGLSELNMDGEAVGIVLKNIDWFYVGSERGLDFRVQIDPDYDILTVRKNIQVNLTKYLDFRFWQPGGIIQWDDLLDIVKKSEGVKYVPDEYFFPYYDQQVPVNQLPRIKGFIMRDEKGNILFDSGSTLSPLFYPTESEDKFAGLTDNSLSQTQTAYFTVVDEEGNPVPNARITIDINSVLTNDRGQATLTLENGNYTYQCTKNMYETTTGTFVVLNNSVSIEIELRLAPYTVTFVTIDGDNPTKRVQNVNIAIEGIEKQITTNSNGVATVQLKDGEYFYSASSLGYEEINRNRFVVNGSNITVTVNMYLKAFEATVTVLDTLNKPIASVIVGIGEQTYLTNQEGQVVLNLVNGNYNLTFSKVGYIELKGSIKVLNKNETYFFTMQSFEYDATILVLSEVDNTPLQGAEVKIQDNAAVLLTDEKGEVTFKLINGNYTYQVKKDQFDDYSGSFNINNDDVKVQAKLSLKHYNSTITVIDELGEPIEGAQVRVNNSLQSTNEEGKVVLSLQNGTYPFTASKLGYEENQGTLYVFGQEASVICQLSFRLWNVVLQVKGLNEEPLSNVDVIVDQKTYNTNSEGEISLNLKNGTHQYSINHTGYEEVNSSFEVSNEDTSVIVQLEEKQYAVSIVVSNKNTGAPINKATVTINEKQVTTNSNGIAEFKLKNGSYAYTITKEGYNSTSGNIQVLNQGITQSISLLPLSFDITFSVKDTNSTPLNGVSVLIGEESYSTNQEGQVVVSLFTGSYTVTYNLEGYKSETTQIEITKAITIEQSLNKIYQLSFKVTEQEKTKGNLSGVTIKVSGDALLDPGIKTLVSKADGTTDAIDVINGNYSYNAYLEGYSPEEGEGTILNGDKIQAIDLAFGFETTFFAQDNDTTPIEGVSILIDNTQTIVTGSNGKVSVNLSNGQHSYSYSKSGYVSGSGSVTVNNEIQTVNISMILGAVVNVTVRDSDGLISGAVVKFTDEEDQSYQGTTSSNGKTTVNLPNGNYTITVEKTGYENWIGSTEVNGSTIDIPIDLTNNKYYSAEVFGGTYVGVAAGFVQSEMLKDVIITATKGDKKTTVGTWSTKTITLDGDTQPAEVPIFIFSQLTNGTWTLSVESTEKYWFNESLNDRFAAAAEFPIGKITINGSSLTLDGELIDSMSGQFIMIWPIFTGITMTVKNDEGGYINGADIKTGSNFLYLLFQAFDVIVGTTNTFGIATLRCNTETYPDTFPESGILGDALDLSQLTEEAISSVNMFYYQIEAPGYETIKFGDAIFIVKNNNTNFDVTMTSAAEITFSVKDSSQTAVSEATIEIYDGSSKIDSKVTDSSGNATFDLPKGKSYTYKVKKTGYYEISKSTGTITETKTIEVLFEKTAEITISSTFWGGRVSYKARIQSASSSFVPDGDIDITTSISTSSLKISLPIGRYYVLSIDQLDGYIIEISNNGNIPKLTEDGHIVNCFFRKTYTYTINVRRANSTNGLSSAKVRLHNDSLGYDETKTGSSCTFTEVPYDVENYNILIEGGDYWTQYRVQSLSITNSGNRTVNVTPLYDIKINTGEGSATIKFVDSGGNVHNATSNSSSYYIFNQIPAGNYSVEVSKSGFTTNRKTGTISQTSSLQQTIDCLVLKQPKLVQITTNQSNYRLDTSYKYLSMLVVGKGGDAGDLSDTTKWYDDTYSGKSKVCNGSGSMYYIKNLPTNSLSSSNCSIKFEEDVTVVTVDSSNKIQTSPIIYESWSQGIGAEPLETDVLGIFKTYLYNASSNGGDYSFGWDDSTQMFNFCGQGGGTNGHGGTLSNNGYDNGGDGTGGYAARGSNVAYEWGYKLNSNIIPVSSIFEGTGRGGYGTIVSYQSNYLYYGGGGGSYGNGASGLDSPGYGGGGCRTRRGIKGGPGIVVLYYHNDPL